MKFHIGRLGQTGFTVAILVSFAIVMALVLLNAAEGLLMTFVYVNFAWMVLLYVGRLHDVGYSGWWTLLVMFTAVLGMIALSAWPGKKEANKYGEVPPRGVLHLLHFWRS